MSLRYIFQQRCEHRHANTTWHQSACIQLPNSVRQCVDVTMD